MAPTLDTLNPSCDVTLPCNLCDILSVLDVSIHLLLLIQDKRILCFSLRRLGDTLVLLILNMNNKGGNL